MIGWSRRGVRRGHDIHSRSQHGSWRLGHVGADRARWIFATPAAAHSPENGWATTTTLLQLTTTLGRRDEPWQGRTIVDLSLGHGQYPRERGHGRHAGHVAFMSCCASSRRSSWCWQPCDLADFRSVKSCIQTQASITFTRTVIDGSFDAIVRHKA